MFPTISSENEYNLRIYGEDFTFIGGGDHMSVKTLPEAKGYT